MPARPRGGGHFLAAGLVATALVVTVGLVATACSSPGAPSPIAASVTAESPWQKTMLWLEQGGQSRPFSNGGVIVAGDLNVEVFVAPYPPVREGSIDLYITDRATSQPVESGALAVSFDMYMPHGTIKAEALPMGGGHYLVPYKLVMPGEWRVDLTTSGGSSAAAWALIFRVD